MISSEPPPMVFTHLTINPLDTITTHVAETAQNLHGLTRAKLHHFAGLHLEQGDIAGVGCARLDRLVAQSNVGLRRIQLLLHLRNFVPDHLVIGEAFAEGLTFGRPGNRLLKTDATIGFMAAAIPMRSLLKLVMMTLKSCFPRRLRFRPAHALRQNRALRYPMPTTPFCGRVGFAKNLGIGGNKEHGYASRLGSAGAHRR